MGRTESTHITPFLLRWLGSPRVKFWLSPHSPASVSKVRPRHLPMRAHLAIPPISGLRKGPFLQEDPLDHDLRPLSRQVHCKSLLSPLQSRCLAPRPHTASDKPTASEASPGSWIQAGSRVSAPPPGNQLTRRSWYKKRPPCRPTSSPRTRRAAVDSMPSASAVTWPASSRARLRMVRLWLAPFCDMRNFSPDCS